MEKITKFSTGTCLLAAGILVAAGLSLNCLSCRNRGAKNMEEQRKIMVKNQIQSRGITSSLVLDAMRKVERHHFVPRAYRSEAYADHPLPIGNGQTISQPYIVALMSELCELSGSEKVLEIGTGSGYQAAVLSLLAKEVYSIEIVPGLGKAAEKLLAQRGYSNVTVRIGDGYRGWPEKAPFDVIILTASPPKIPQALVDQLDEGGILVAPEGDYVQQLVKLKKRRGKINKDTITYVRFVPMVHEKQ